MRCLPAVERGSHLQQRVLEDLPAEETQPGASQGQPLKPRLGLTLLWTSPFAQSHHPSNRFIRRHSALLSWDKIKYLAFTKKKKRRVTYQRHLQFPPHETSEETGSEALAR